MPPYAPRWSGNLGVAVRGCTGGEATALLTGSRHFIDL